MKIEIIDETTKRGAGGLDKNGIKLLRHYVAEASDHLYNDFLKREKPETIQVFVNYLEEGVLGRYLSSKDNCIRIRIEKSIIHYTEDTQYCNPKRVIAHELVHGVDVIQRWRDEYNAFRDCTKRYWYSLEGIMAKIDKWRSEGVARLGETLIYPELEKRYPRKEIVLDSFIHLLEELLAGRNVDQKIWYEDADIVLVEAMRGLGLITDEEAVCYCNNFYIYDDATKLLRDALSMSLSQFIEGIFIACMGKSSLVEKLLSYCASILNRKEKDKVTLFILLTEDRMLKVNDYNETMEEIVGTIIPDEMLEQMVRDLRENDDNQANSNALRMINPLYDFYLQYKEDNFYKEHAKAANWALNYYFKRIDLIHDDLVFWGHVDDMMLLKATQRMIDREMGADLIYQLNDAGDGLVVTGCRSTTCDIYIPAWLVFEGKRYPVLEVRLGDVGMHPSLYISENVETINTDDLWGGLELLSIRVAERNLHYDSREGCNAIIETATNQLIVGCKATTIPFTVTSIGSGAFRHCLSWDYRCGGGMYKDLLIPDGVVEIAPDAFECFRGVIYFRDPSMIEPTGFDVKSI